MWRTMRTGDVVESTVCEILESSGDPGSRVILHRRHIDDFGQLMCDDACHVRARLPFAKEVGVTVDRWFIGTTRGERLLNSYNSNSRRQQRLIASDVNLIRITVIDRNITRGNSNRLNRADDLAHDLGRRTTGWRARRVDFDSNHVLGLNEL